MLNLINWDRPIKVNGVIYNSSKEAYEVYKDKDVELEIELNFDVVEQIPPPQVEEQIDENTYKIKVRQYMTKQWDLNYKFNRGIPLPMRIMVGKRLITKGKMTKWELIAKPMPSKVCLHCGKKLTNPISMLYGLGPECGGHYYNNPLETEEQVKQYYNELRNNMENVKWVGWIPNSAIESEELYNEQGNDLCVGVSNR